MRSIILIGIAILLSIGVAQASDWPMFGHDAAHTGVATEVVEPPLELLWKYAGSFYSSPTVSDGVVYIGSGDGNVYALDARTGSLKWKYKTDDNVWSSPAISGGMVYVGSRDKNLYAIDATTGTLKWKFMTLDSVDSSPVVSDGVVYVGSYDENVYAIDAKTGALKWKYRTGVVDSSPAVSGGAVYVGSRDKNLYAIDAVTGTLKWKYMIGNPIISTPAVSGGVIYVGSWDKNVYAIDAVTGALKWKYMTESGVDSLPAVSGGVVYVGSWDKNVYAIDAATGTLKWKYTTESSVYSSSAAVSGNVVYIKGSYDNNVYAIDAATGTLKWIYATEGNGISSPAISDGVVYVGGNGNLYAFKPSKITTSGVSPTTTSAPWTNVGSKVLTVGETWDVGYGWTLSAPSIDAKASPRQVWLVLSKDGVKLDDKVLSEGQTYNFNDIFLTKINRIWAGPTSDLVELTDAVVNLASNPTPTPSITPPPIMTPIPTETLILQTPEPQDKTNWVQVSTIPLLLIGVIIFLFYKLKKSAAIAIKEPVPKFKPPQRYKIKGILLIIILIVTGAIGFTIYQKYSPLAELANCGNNCIDYKKVIVAQYETSVPDIKITNAYTDKLIMDVPIIIRNPSAEDTETVKIDFDVSMEGKHLTKGTIPAYELPAKQNTTILIKDVVIKYEELGDVLQKVAERHGAEMVREGKANISMTTDLLIYFPIELFSINIYTFTIPIQIQSEVPVDMLKQNEEAKRQIEEKVSTAIKEVQEKIKDTLPAIPTKTIPSPTATLPQKTALPLPAPSNPQFP